MKIRREGSPVLKMVAEEVKKGEEVRPIIDGMFAVMDQNFGIGLAANQIGELKRIIVINVGGLREAFINPVITRKFGGWKTSREGCLSFPGRPDAKVVRYKRVTIEAMDRNFNPVKRSFKGQQSCCIQHEIDHLNGKCIF